MDPTTTRNTPDARLDPFHPASVSSAWGSVDLAPVRAFIDAHGLRKHAETAVRLAREAFPDAKGVTVQVENESDPVTACLVIDVATGLGPVESLHRREQFIRRWLPVAPPEVAERIILTLDLS